MISAFPAHDPDDDGNDAYHGGQAAEQKNDVPHSRIPSTTRGRGQ